METTTIESILIVVGREEGISSPPPARRTAELHVRLPR